MNNKAIGGSDLRPVYASSVPRLTSFYAILWISHSDSTGRFKRLRLDAENGI